LDRDRAIAIVDEMLTDPNLKKHCFAVEAIMRALAQNFKADEDEWGLVGLLHDADYEVTEKDPNRHMHVIVAKARKENVSETIIQGILAHGGLAPLDNKLNASIFACDHLAGLITAYALLHPKGLAGVKTKGVLKRFRQAAFARGVNRGDILTCEANLGLPLTEFVAIGVEAMQTIRDELGL